MDLEIECPIFSKLFISRFWEDKKYKFPHAIAISSLKE